MFKKIIYFFVLFILSVTVVKSQDVILDTLHPKPVEMEDSTLRITNLNPYITLHVDSVLSYPLSINREASKYYWYLKNSPIGLKINKDNGTLTFKAEKSFFLSGKLKYDEEYPVKLGVQNLSNPRERVDTSFVLVFYNTDVILPKLKPSVGSTLIADEGETISFSVQCEAGNFTIDDILFTSNISISNYKSVRKCGDEFSWTIPFDFVKETDTIKTKILNLSFIGSTTKFQVRDTANVRITVRDALNYPRAKQEYDVLYSQVRRHSMILKATFIQIDRKIRKNKGARTSFDLTSATSALTGTILSTSGGASAETAGKILPSAGVALVPVKEATAPNKVVEQNQAAVLRSSIKRLDYMLFEFTLVGDRDPLIASKTAKLKEELKQSQMQVIDVPLDVTLDGMTEDELNKYFNNPKVNKKYRVSNKGN
ncbi:hypothetical protein LZZ85_20500 [Terrimonas sp. NA20]|uniref:Uncharacterized protein n=1 Tax=Terrimonas ginsenosidimutans TaxID=2908004 RepID=A0ABS9KWJ3_9BACT|nr:hypothetical protein [Terrimonas ginsenosidimutans]MCG2616691.1 hypothetical protein [Terrimonas ginsenosidimutans]